MAALARKQPTNTFTFAAEKSEQTVAEATADTANMRTAANNALFKAFIDTSSVAIHRNLTIREEFFAALKQKDAKGRNCFHIAAASGNFELFRLFLGSNDQGIKQIFTWCLNQKTGRLFNRKTPIDLLVTTENGPALASELNEFLETQKDAEKELNRQQEEQ
jgi:hypothetical protein